MNKEKKELLIVLAMVLGAYFLAMLAGITCPILYVTGIPCPGCGMTRAWRSFFQGDLRNAFRFHPLFWLPAVLLVLWPFRRKLSARTWDALMTVLIVLVLAVWLLRFFLPGDPVVHLDFAHSLIGKLFLTD